jgi:hypothetical protein
MVTANTGAQPANNAANSMSDPGTGTQPQEGQTTASNFRNLVALLRVLRVINNPTGYPSLPSDAPNMENIPNRQRVIDAITTILVMKHEIVAAVAFNKPVDDTQGRHLFTGGLVYTENDPIISNVDDSDSMTEEEDLDSNDGIIESVAAIANPREDDNNHFTFSTINEGGLTLLPRMESLWPAVRTGDFSGLHK